MSILSIKNLHISTDGQKIVKGIDLIIKEGEVHAIMGPNGSGKSTLVNALMGNPKYTITDGEILFKGRDLLALDPHERAQAGLFLAFQYPRTIEGVSLRSFLFSAYSAQMAARFPDKRKISPITFQALLQQKMDLLKLDHFFAERSVNEGFSGGEKKKAEVLQMLTLEPELALLDETDSGLDIDALKVVAEGINELRVAGHESLVTSRPATSDQRPATLIVTHYARILDYIKPDFVHVMEDGRITRSGNAELAGELEKVGYGE
ncbi:MAG: Fe-S cluster assembly ATPase SufC, partial [Patescibacteria group bacterium]